MATRRAEILAGTHVDGDARRLKLGELLDAVLRDYKANGNDHEWAERVIRKHLLPRFGNVIALKLKRAAIDEYMRNRRDAGDANGTINRALPLLHRAFTLGQESGRISMLPPFPKKLKESNVSKGFFERDEFVSVRSALPDEIKSLATFAFWTGRRKGEILHLQWPQVDLASRIIRLEPGETKNDEPRIIPLAEELHQMLCMQKAIRDQKWPDFG